MSNELDTLKKEIEELNKDIEVIKKVLDLHNEIFIKLLKRLETLENMNKIIDMLEKGI